MTYTKTIAAIDAALASDRPVVVYALDDLPWPSRYVEDIAEALAQGLDVDFKSARSDPQPWFRLRAYRGAAVHVLGADFRHLATVASVAFGLGEGWARGGSLRTGTKQP